MQVKLLTFTSDPEVLAAAAAHLCYHDVSAVDIVATLDREQTEHLLRVVLDSGHLSVVEHVTFTFAIDGISRVTSHQLVRHRVGTAISQQSQRYANVQEAGYVLPHSIAGHRLANSYEQNCRAAIRLYRELIESGVPNEDARYVLPQSIETRLLFTVNMRELRHMYEIDACLRSQWEIRRLVNLMKREIRAISPRLAQELKIKCFRMGSCDETNMCATLEGRMPRRDDVRARVQIRRNINLDEIEREVDQLES